MVVAPTVRGASSQCAEITRIAVGFAGRSADQPASSRVHTSSSANGGAPWLRYITGIRSETGVASVEVVIRALQDKGN